MVLSKDVIKLRDTWNTLLANFEKMKQLVTELASHPESTDEQVLKAARTLGRIRNELREVQRFVIKKAKSDYGSFFDRNVYDRIIKTKL